jgi:hypothetical protein
MPEPDLPTAGDDPNFVRRHRANRLPVDATQFREGTWSHSIIALNARLRALRDRLKRRLSGGYEQTLKDGAEVYSWWILEALDPLLEATTRYETGLLRRKRFEVGG